MIDGKKSILAIDDDPDICQMLKRRLELSGYHFNSTDSVEKGLALIEEGDIDLVILDLGLKTYDGTSLLQLKASWESQGKIMPPIIVLSGLNNDEVREYTLDLGASQYLNKPYDAQELLASISQCTA